MQIRADRAADQRRRIRFPIRLHTFVIFRTRVVALAFVESRSLRRESQVSLVVAICTSNILPHRALWLEAQSCSTCARGWWKSKRRRRWFLSSSSIFASSSNQSAAKHDDERIQHSYLVRRPRSNLLIPFRRWMLRVRSCCDLDWWVFFVLWCCGVR